MRLAASAALVSAGLGPMPIEARETQPAPAAAPIVVTGSRIAGHAGPPTAEIRTIPADSLLAGGSIALGDALNQQPGFRASWSQQNSSRSVGTAGLNLLDLRGLDKKRTIVLQNGRRHVAADLLAGASSVDINQIPAGLLERVEIVTGGNSAIYGSDAIAGVVNFILRQDFEGLKVRARQAISTYGDGPATRLGLTAGASLAGGRGNIAVDLEYARQADFYAPDRPHTRTLNGYFQFDSDPAGTPNGSDGIADRRFLRDVRLGFQSDGGTVLAIGPAGITPWLFQADGTLVRQNGTPSGSTQLGPIPIFIGGNGSNPNGGKRLGLMPRLERAGANLIAHYEVIPAFVPFIEAKYVRTDSLGNSSGPFFLPSISSPRAAFFTTNPFLTDQARALLRTQVGDLFGPGRRPGPDGIPDSDQFGFTFTRMVTDFGNREEEARRQTWRMVGGVRGAFGAASNWNWEASVNYGRFTEATRITGNVNVQRLLLAIDAVRDPASGTIVCRARIDPAAARTYEQAGDQAAAAARLAEDVRTCVPANLFGEGNLSAAAREYIVQDTVSRGRITQLVAGGQISGDSAGFLVLPGGPVALALGAEHRREAVNYRQDPLVSAGLTAFNPLPAFAPPAFAVSEAFGEVHLPLLKNAPLARTLSIDLAARVSDHRGSAGTTLAWNGGAAWQPVSGLMLRANYARSVRAPSLSERHAAQGTSFASVTDPCSIAGIGAGSPTRATNCTAAGMPAGFNHIYTTGLRHRTGGNPDLKVEYADSYTFGAELSPAAVPGLTLSVSYYDITVNDVIAQASPQSILNACYDAPAPGHPFCDLFARAGPSGGPQGEAPFRILEGSLRAVQLNYAQLKTRGLDFDLSYSGALTNRLRIDTRLRWNRALQNDEYLSPTDPARANQRLLELGFPRDTFIWDTRLTQGAVTLGHRVRYVGKATVGAYEDTNAKQGRPPENADFAERRYYGGVFYHDLQLGFAIGSSASFQLGVENVTNRMPPGRLSGAGAGTGLYDVRGRYVHAGASFAF